MNDGGEQEGRSNRTWAVLATVGMVSGVVIEGVLVAIEILALFFVPDWELRVGRGEVTGLIFAFTFGWSTVLNLIASLLGIVASLVWLRRAVRFAHAHGTRPSATPAGAVLCWFIPILNLVRPYTVVRSLYRVSRATEPSARHDWVSRWPWILPVWWWAWIATVVLRKIAFGSISASAPVIDSIPWTDIAELVSSMVAASCAAAIVWAIQGGQEALAAAGGNTPEFVPPERASERDDDEDDEDTDEDDDDDE